MAIMFPQWISDEIRNDPGRRAECLVYDELQEQLGDKWWVFYSSPIKYHTDKYGVSDREADFIVAHPDVGVLMIEVKGGSISFEQGVWYTTPLSNPTNPYRKSALSKSPYQQVTDAAKKYERKLDTYIRNQTGPRSERLPKRNFKIGTAVLFPDIPIPDNAHLSADALPEITFSHPDLPNLQQRIYEAIKYHQGRQNDPPGEVGINLLEQVLAKSWHIESPIAFQYENAEKQRKKLTEAQFNLLYSFESNPRMLISGCAGSGKTMLAAEHARRLAAGGQDVLFVCFNKNLAEWLRDSPFARDRIKFSHFHGLCRWAAERAGIDDLPEWQDIKDDPEALEQFQQNDLPEALIQAAEELGESIEFDAIIVDEGQDFQSFWLEVLLGVMLKDPEEGAFYIFYDNNQKLYDRKTNIPFGWFDYYLSQNMRNTDQIFEELKKYYIQSGKTMLPSGISGPGIQHIPFERNDNPHNKLQELLEELTSQKFKLSDIAVLSPLDRNRSKWRTIPHQSKFFPVWDIKSDGNQRFKCSSVRQFKGLECPIVILTELAELSDSAQIEEMLYVAISRAKYQLIILGESPPL